MGLKKAIWRVGTALLLLIACSQATFAADPILRSAGQTIYASAYSYVLMGSGQHKFRVTSTLVIRNTDLNNSIKLINVDYRDSEGDHLRHYLDKPLVIAPLSSTEFVVRESDLTGGHSPSFILQWQADTLVNAPVVETLMIGGASTQGISFVGRAWVLEEAPDPNQMDESQ